MGSFVGAREDQLHQSEPAQQHSLDSFSTGWRPSCAAARTASMPSKPNAARHMGKKRSRPQASADTALTDCSVAILAKRNHQRPSSVSPSSSPYLRDASKDICSGVPVRRCMGAVCKQQAEETGISTPRKQVISREQVLQQMTAVGSATKGKAHNSSKIQQDSTNENYQEQQQEQEQACQQQQQEQQPSSSADTQQTAQPVYWDDTSYKPLNFGWMQPCRFCDALTGHEGQAGGIMMPLCRKCTQSTEAMIEGLYPPGMDPDSIDTSVEPLYYWSHPYVKAAVPELPEAQRQHVVCHYLLQRHGRYQQAASMRLAQVMARHQPDSWLDIGPGPEHIHGAAQKVQ